MHLCTVPFCGVRYLEKTGDAGCDSLSETLRERKLVKYQGLLSRKRIFDHAVFNSPEFAA
jgi:hypothetical protein